MTTKLCTNTSCSIVNERYSPLRWTVAICSTYAYHVGECQGSVSCGGMKRLHTEAVQQLRNCNEWNSFGYRFSHRVVATSCTLALLSASAHHTRLASSAPCQLVSLFSVVDQTLSWTKVIAMWWLSTVLVTATWHSSFIVIVQEHN